MSIEKIIKDYLDSSYQLILGKNYYIITTKNGLNKIERKDIYDTLYDMGFLEDEFTPIVDDWVSTAKSKINEHFNKFIEDYRLEFLSNSIRIVNEKNNELDVYQLIKIMEPYYETPELVRKIYEYWVLNKIIEEGDKHLGIFSHYELE